MEAPQAEEVIMLPLETRIHEIIVRHSGDVITPKLIRKLTEDIMEQILIENIKDQFEGMEE